MQRFRDNFYNEHYYKEFNNFGRVKYYRWEHRRVMNHFDLYLQYMYNDCIHMSP